MPHIFATAVVPLTTLCFVAGALRAQGVVPPFRVNLLNPVPGLSAPLVPGTNVQQVNFVHLPTDPPQVFLCTMTVAGLPAQYGGLGGTDLLSGSYNALTDTFTPTAEASALNTAGTEFGLMVHHTALYAVFDRLPGQPWLAARAAVGMPWQIVGQMASLGVQPYYDPALADVNGQTHLPLKSRARDARRPRSARAASVEGFLAGDGPFVRVESRRHVQPRKVGRHRDLPCERGTQLAHVGEHLRDGGEERRRARTVEFGVGVQRPRKHRHRPRRGVRLFRKIADRRREKVGAFPTTRGAPTFLSSYFSATAQWVGFIPTRSAVGTRVVMRRMVISRMRARMLALISW